MLELIPPCGDDDIRPMYERFFGFRELPFRLTPDPNYLFLSRKHGEAFAHLLYAVREGSGFVAVTGEIGAGKTTLVRTLLKELRDTKERVAAAYIFNPVYSPVELLQSINAELGLPSRSGSKKELTEHLNAFLLAQKNDGGRTLVIVDEAQNLDAVILEELRLLSNLETETEKLLHIVLIGQPELRDLLDRPELLQLSQRITVRWHLNSLDRIETAEYVRHRLRVAGGPNVGGIFDAKALAAIYDHSGGVPRLINILAHRALLVAYTKGLHAVGAPEVALAAAELEEGRYPIVRVGRNWIYRLAAGIGVAVSAAVVALLLLSPLRGDDEDPGGHTARPTSVVKAPPLQTGTSGAKEGSRKDKAELVNEARTTEAAGKHGKAAERFARRLAKVSVYEGATQAVTKLFELWSQPPLTRQEKSAPSLELEAAARKRGLRYLVGSMTPALIEAIDLPAILELDVPHEKSSHFVLLTKLTADMATIQGKQQSVDVPRWILEKFWNGRAHILWSDRVRFGRTLGPGSGGPGVLRLQGALREVGVYRGIVDGVYGDTLAKAVREFQSRHNLQADGVAGPLTQIMLYNALSRFHHPVLIDGERTADARSRS